ncbi:CHAP domain-containing protein [Trebonia sp.]|uniref:CHAP domain-containing protein n=1 Tax=Trebonia sp. TaxID=2767075 RepID=UPI00261939FA|nr:CHAP domain-containing protein [Trebonia sp.]
MWKSIRDRNVGRWLAAGASAVFLAVTVIAATAAPSFAAGTYSTTASVNVRTGPGTGYASIGIAPSGAQFTLQCQWQGGTNINGNATWDDVTFANGLSGAITDYYTTTPSWNSYAPGTGPCGSTQVVVHSLGGVDMQQACDTQYPGRGLEAVATNANSAYSWQCVGPGTSLGIDVTAECATQYGNGAVAAVTNPASAWSWYCHWEIGRTLTYNSGDIGQCVAWAINEFHQYDGMYPNTIDPADNGNAMYLATNAAYNGWAVSSTPRVNSIAVFQPGANGAGAAGHAAWVISVSAPYITVSEMNFTYGPGKTDTRTLIPASSVRYVLAP